MNCRQCIEVIDDFLDEQLSAKGAASVREHIASCNHCYEAVLQERVLRNLVRDVPTSQPSEARLDGLLTKATEEGERRERRRIGVFVSSALAASLAIWAVTATFFLNSPLSPNIPGLKLTLHEPRDVKLVMDSPRLLKDAVFTLHLPGDVELVGHPGRKLITWKANVNKGKNILVLPVVARGYGGGELITEITHNNKHKKLVVKMEIQKQDISRHNTERILG